MSISVFHWLVVLELGFIALNLIDLARYMRRIGQTGLEYEERAGWWGSEHDGLE